MELPHNRGHSGDRGRTKRLATTVLDSRVEERIRGRETSFWDERAVEQGLVIDPLGLPGNEPVWIFRRGGAALEVEPHCYILARVDFCGAMLVDLGLKIYKH